jgi:AraC family transcriptional regulator, regulatory protein of adaptative response / methylated-DNA-[protein]-cysteine methyltransferase
MDLVRTEGAPVVAGEEPRWEAALQRDAARDGAFVHAVRRAGLHCRMIEAAEETSGLEALSAAVGMRPFHFHRMFRTVTARHALSGDLWDVDRKRTLLAKEARA